MIANFEGTDLIDRPEIFRDLTPPAKLAVFGDPISQSKSPVFQNAALRSLGINAQYVRIRVDTGALADCFRTLPAAGFLGANITLPHKTATVAAMDRLDDCATAIHAVNTVRVESNGTLSGFSTDGPGFANAISEEFHVNLADLRVLVLGAGGGAGRAIAFECARQNCRRLALLNRSVEKVHALAGELSGFAKETEILALPQIDDTLSEQLDSIDLIVNATSLGMKPDDPALVPVSLLSRRHLVYDAVYAHGTTRLVTDAREAGALAANGLSMLLHQGALAFKIWFNRPAPLDAMRAALQAV